MKKSILSAVLLCTMIFTACNKPQENSGDPVELSEGIVLAVGKTEMTTGEFQFFLDNVKTQMEGTELSGEAGWESEIEGKKAIDIAKERAYESAVSYLNCIEIAKNMGLSNTKQEVTDLKGRINAEYFAQYENSEDIIDLLCEAELYTAKLQEKLVEERPVNADDLEKCFEENKEELEANYLRAKHVLILTNDEETNEPLPEDQKASKKAEADVILSRAKSGEDFDALVKEFSQDPGSQSYPDGYVFTSGEMVQEFEDGVRNLKIGGIDLVESSYGYHIIQRLELTPASCNSILMNVLYSERFVEYLDDYAKEYNITVTRNDEEYNKIK